MGDHTQVPLKRGVSLEGGKALVVGVPWTDSFGDLSSPGYRLGPPSPDCGSGLADGIDEYPEKKNNRTNDRQRDSSSLPGEGRKGANHPGIKEGVVILAEFWGSSKHECNVALGVSLHTCY